MPSDTTASVLPPEPETVTEERAREDALAHKALESKAMQGTFWMVADYGISMGLRLVNSFVLTRLLMPEAFGLLTLVTTIVVGISLISDIGLGPSVIQSKRGDDPVFLNTVWTLQALRGLGIFLFAVLLAWPMSVFYNHDSRLIALVIALALTTLVGAFNSTNLLTLSRHLGVRRLFVFDTCTQIVTLLVTVGWALLVSRSVWALVAGCFGTCFFRLAVGYYRPLVPGIRNKFQWDKESVRGLVHFGKWILVGTAFFFFASQADRLILGKLISFTLLGVYGIAYQVSDIPRAIINAFSQKVGYPFIAKMVHLPIEEFRKMFLRYRFRTLVAGAFLLCLMTYLGGFLVTKVYDSRYHAASWMVPVLALGLWHTLMYQTTLPALFSLGKSNYSAIGNAGYAVFVAAGIYAGFHFFGIFGAVVAVAAGDLPLYVVSVVGASRERISTWQQDLQTTGVFLAFLGLGYAIRFSIAGNASLFAMMQPHAK